MKNRITYHWGESHLLIKLGNQIEPRIKILFIAEFLFMSGMATIFLFKSLPLSQGMLNWLSCIAAGVLYILAGARFLSRIFYREQLLLDPDFLVIVSATPFQRKIRSYEWKKTGRLHYTGKISKTDHPLKGNSFDYFGFETQEYLIQSLHREGNIFFDYEGIRVHFGKGIRSWDAEDMVHMMKLFAGPSLRLGPEWREMLQEHEI
jgi:hypothetical protein